MDHDVEQKSSLFPVLITAGIALVLLVLCGGAAFTAVKGAQLSAAKASIGHIEAALLLAETKAELDGLGSPPETYQNLLKSYGSDADSALNSYEKYILETMLAYFGPSRDFDFAVTRYQGSADFQTQVYFFPKAGQTDMKRDRYYFLSGNTVSENNA